MTDQRRTCRVDGDHRIKGCPECDLIVEVERLKLSMTRLLDAADDLIADWQSGNIQTKDMAVRLHAFVEDVRAAAKDQP